MKILDVIGEEETNGAPRFKWRVLPDSALLKSRNPFFVPDFPGTISATPALAVRICRLGKSIPARFATRYYAECAPTVVFRAEQYARQLRAEGLPDAPAYSFDKAVITGEFHTRRLPDNILFRLTLDNPEADEYFRLENVEQRIGNAIELLSRDNTLKTGDLLLIGADGIPLSVAEESKLHLQGMPVSEGEEELEIKLK